MTADRTSSVKRDRLLLTLIGLLVFGAGIGLRDPWPPDEPRFALVARQMVESSDWLFPRRAGELYSHKPPLFLWTVALVFRVTGSLRIAFLLPSLLSGLATILLVHDLARRLWNRRVAITCAVALTTVMQFLMQARAGQIDAFVTLWTTLAIYGFARHFLSSPSLFWFYAAFAAMGAGILSKGVGFLPLFMLIPLGYASRRDWRHLSGSRVATVHLIGGMLLMIGVVALWLVPMVLAVQASGDPALVHYRDDILLRQTAGRYANPWHHFKPPWYFVVSVIPWAWLPLSALLPWAVPAWLRRLRRRDGRLLMLLGWVLLVIAFFSLSPAKRGVYILPALPAFCLAFAPLLPGLIRLRGVQRMFRALLVIVSIVLALVGSLVLLDRVRLPERAFATDGDLFVTATAIGAVALLSLALAILPLRTTPAGYAALIWIIFMAAGWLVFPLMNDISSARKFMHELRPLLGKSEELGILAWREQFVLQSDRKVQTFGYGRGDFDQEAREGARWLLTGSDRALLVTDEHAAFCFDTAKTIQLARQSRRNWLLARRDSIKPECAPEQRIQN